MSALLAAYLTGAVLSFFVTVGLCWIVEPDLLKNARRRYTHWRARQARRDAEDLKRLTAPYAPPREIVVASATVSKQAATKARQARTHVAKSPLADRHTEPTIEVGMRRRVRSPELPALADDQPTAIIRTDDWKTAEFDVERERWQQEALIDGVL